MQVQDIQDEPMEINYTLTNPTNDYWSDVYSPWQTKLQLEIWLEVNPIKKPKIWEKSIDDTTKTRLNVYVQTRSRNIKMEIKTVRKNDWAISEWTVEYKTDTQRCTNNNWDEITWRIFSFDNNSNWVIEKITPWWFKLSIVKERTERFNLSFVAYNNDFSF